MCRAISFNQLIDLSSRGYLESHHQSRVSLRRPIPVRIFPRCSGENATSQRREQLLTREPSGPAAVYAERHLGKFGA